MVATCLRLWAAAFFGCNVFWGLLGVAAAFSPRALHGCMLPQFGCVCEGMQRTFFFGVNQCKQ